MSVDGGLQLRPAELGAHLTRKLLPLYVVHGDEPLGVIEAADSIRAAAREVTVERWSWAGISRRLLELSCT